MSAPLNYVYFLRPIGAEGPVKIEQSRCPLIRLKAISSWSPVELEIAAHTPGARGLEARLHALFAKERLHGEWFSSSVALSALITDIQRGEFDADSLPSERVRGDSNWTDVSTPAPEFLAIVSRADAAGVPVRDLLHETSIAATTWWRWAEGRTEPRLQSLRLLNAAIDKLSAEAANDSSDREQAA